MLYSRLRWLARVLAALFLLAILIREAPAQTAFGITPQFARSLAVTTASGRVQLGGNGSAVLITNTGATNVFLGFGDVTVVATTSGHSLASGQCIVYNAPANSYVAAITASSTSTIKITQGNGATSCGGSGGSGGGGGGGAVTIADGADTAEGTTTDAACAGDATSGCTVLSRLSRIAARLTTIIGTGIPITNTNANGGALPANSSPVVNANQYSAYETVAASQTGQALGATGGSGDYLSHCVVYPGTTSPGVVTVFDSTSSATNNVIVFTGGSTSVSNLVPFAIPVGAFSLNGAWKVTTGANVIVTCYGKFT